MSAVENLRQELTTLEGEYGALLATAGDEQAIRKVYADFGGADGAIRKRHKAALAAAPGPEKRDIGKLGNEILQRVEKQFEAHLEELVAEAQQRDLERQIDLSLPKHQIGRAHV